MLRNSLYLYFLYVRHGGKVGTFDRFALSISADFVCICEGLFLKSVYEAI